MPALPLFSEIEQKVHAGERLSVEDGLVLLDATTPLCAVGELADSVNRAKNGDTVYYNINIHLNPTNVCINHCAFCAYRTDPDDPRSYVLNKEDILQCARDARSSGCTEIHIVGGLHPDRDYPWYLDILKTLQKECPGVNLKAWTPVEIEWFARLAGKPTREILSEMIDAGMTAMPGGGAEIFDAKVRKKICPDKPDADAWLDVHRNAHQLGVGTNATMLFGHIEEANHQTDHLLRLRELQDETGGFNAFVPLVFHPANTRLADRRRSSAATALRMIATARLMLDNFDNIKAYWVGLGTGTAQTALAFGANDLDGTVRNELIHHDAGAQSPTDLSVSSLNQLITATGHRAVERDSLYRVIHRDAKDFGKWRV